MRIPLILLTFLFIISTGRVFAAQNVTIATYDDDPPYAFNDEQGNHTGIYIEIVKKAISRMPGYTVEFQVQPWARSKKMMESGKSFAILAPYFHAHDWLTETEPKRPYIWPYSRSIYVQTDVVVCRESVLKVPRTQFPQDYQGLLFAMRRGDGRAGVEFDALVKKGKITVELFKKVEHIIPFLASGRADCTVTVKTPFLWKLKQRREEKSTNSNEEKLVISQVTSQNTNHLGYTDVDDEKNYPFKKDFVIKFDIQIYKMKKSGEMDRIIESFLGS